MEDEQVGECLKSASAKMGGGRNERGRGGSVEMGRHEAPEMSRNGI